MEKDYRDIDKINCYGNEVIEYVKGKFTLIFIRYILFHGQGGAKSNEKEKYTT